MTSSQHVVRFTLALFALHAGVTVLQAQTLPYDHMHLSVPDPAKAVRS